MRVSLTSFALAMLATTALAAVAQAQTSAPCVNDAPNPYRLVNDWAHMNRAWAPTAVYHPRQCPAVIGTCCGAQARFMCAQSFTSLYGLGASLTQGADVWACATAAKAVVANMARAKLVNSRAWNPPGG